MHKFWVCPLRTVRLSITKILVARIESSRQSALFEVFKSLGDVQECLLRKRVCSYDCDATSLGLLQKGLLGMGFYQQNPPYENLSVRGVLAGLVDVHLPQKSRTKGSKSAGCPSRKKGCAGLQSTLMHRVRELEDWLGITSDYSG